MIDFQKINWAKFGFGIFSGPKPDGYELAFCFGFWELVIKTKPRNRLIVARMPGTVLEFYSGDKEYPWTTDLKKAKRFGSASESLSKSQVRDSYSWGIFCVDHYCSIEQIERELLDLKECF